MIGFRDIVGYEKVINHLQSSIEAGRVSHAYILEGSEGAGKMTMAKAFAATLQCQEGGTEPCGKCHSCIQMNSDSQPDVIYVTHEKPKTISVEEVRMQVNQDIGIKPYSSKYKIYIIDQAEKMNEAAQNAILKTIEEPPEYAVIMLLTNSADAFLPTINSRCVTLSLRAIPDALVRDYLRLRLGNGQQVDVAASFAQGNIGRALMLAESENFEKIKENAIQLLKEIADMDTYDMGQAVKVINDYDMSVEDYLDMIKVWYRDVLCFKATQDANNLIFKDEVMEIRKQATKGSYGGIQEILEAIEKAKARLRANVNYDLTMELLLETIKENQK